MSGRTSPAWALRLRPAAAGRKTRQTRRTGGSLARGSGAANRPHPLAGEPDGASGAVHATHGFMDYYLCEAEFSRAAMAQAERCIVAADSSKFDRSTLVRVCPLDAVDLLVTDALPGPDLTRGLEAAGVAIHVADRS